MSVDFFFLFISKFHSPQITTLYFQTHSPVELQSYITYRNTTIILKKLFRNIYPKDKTFIQIVESYEKFDFP